MKYTLPGHKVIPLKLERVLALPGDGTEIVKSCPCAAKVKVDTTLTTVEAILQEIVQRNRVLDITISNPPMEEVISTIYRGKLS